MESRIWIVLIIVAVVVVNIAFQQIIEGKVSKIGEIIITVGGEEEPTESGQKRYRLGDINIIPHVSGCGVFATATFEIEKEGFRIYLTDITPLGLSFLSVAELGEDSPYVNLLPPLEEGWKFEISAGSRPTFSAHVLDPYGMDHLGEVVAWLNTENKEEIKQATAFFDWVGDRVEPHLRRQRERESDTNELSLVAKPPRGVVPSTFLRNQQIF